MGPDMLLSCRSILALLSIVLSACAAPGWTLVKSEAGHTVPVRMYKPQEAGPHPAVLVLPTKAGVQAHVLDYAEQIAKKGYVAAVVDYFAGSNTKLGDVHNLIAAYDFIAKLPEVDANRIGMVGFSLGARHAITMMSIVTDQRPAAIVSYYGAIRYAGGDRANIPPILFLHGTLDIEANVESVERFCSEVQATGGVCEKKIYGDTAHAFTHRSQYGGYNPKVTADAFDRSVSWLDKYVKNARRQNVKLAKSEKAVQQATRESRIEHLREKAEQGDAAAQFELFAELGSDDDWVYWLCRAAEGAHAPAQFASGKNFEYGFGHFPKDTVRAYVWYALAAEKAYRGAESARDRLTKQMTLKQVDAAKSMVGEWKPNSSSCERSTVAE